MLTGPPPKFHGARDILLGLHCGLSSHDFSRYRVERRRDAYRIADHCTAVEATLVADFEGVAFQGSPSVAPSANPRLVALNV